MEGSSESGLQKSDGSRWLKSSPFIERNPRLVQGSTVKSSSNALLARKGSETVLLPKMNRWRSHSEFPESELAPDRYGRVVNLRKWLDDPERAVDALECLQIFTQVVEIVHMSHSQGNVFHNLRPSCFVLSSFNRVSFMELASCSNSTSGLLEVRLNSQTAKFKGSISSSPRDSELEGRPLVTPRLQLERYPTNMLPIVSETVCQQQQSEHAKPCSETSKSQQMEVEEKLPFPMKQILLLEINWYTSPEEVASAPSSCASDIYRLGVLLFELFSTSNSLEEKSITMSNLRHRVLPTHLLLKWPKEASFCLWLLHPEPSSRPNLGELSQSEFLNDPKEQLEDQDAAIELREKIAEQELLLEFLLLMHQKKLEAAEILNETVSFLSTDIEEVTNMKTSMRIKGASDLAVGKDPPSNRTSRPQNDDDNGNRGSRKRSRPGLGTCYSEVSGNQSDEYKISKTLVENEGTFLSKSSRLMNDFKKIEAAYYLTRRRSLKPAGKPLSRHPHISSDGKCSALVAEKSSVSNLSSKGSYNKGTQSGWINSFLEGLCKYLSFSKLEVKADLKQGDLLNSSNLVCSLSFDRDGEFFASAGVNKKIKVFEYNSILNEDHDIHYPVVEMESKSKLSSICWNSYIKSQIASSNFEGVVQVWDVTRSQLFMEMREHERRVWSVDFSVADPTMLASGSDDGSVKLWNINQASASVGTIKTKANVCCVQFPFDSGHSLAFGSADHRIYYYDLRNSKIPLCTLIGHNKTVSYVKFIDSTTLVSASTDNTIKLWDLSMCTSRILDCPIQSYSGHMNVKNFVGLSVCDGYIATGSETNEVYIYHKAFPMPALSSNKFTSTDPLSGDAVDDTSQFISSVCWHGKSSTLVAANSMGNMKILDMV
ncbi:unnamed protein product [Cuscuta campestris]|uniref:Protein kinase domain-containing protein n=1 Tax=Cuscuta campestris TaxID=132261 RepID=A0A484M3L9_9ASTE|nr:unnamed protein product [Cuscuta campestris]